MQVWYCVRNNKWEKLDKIVHKHFWEHKKILKCSILILKNILVFLKNVYVKFITSYFFSYFRNKDHWLGL